MNSSSSFQNTHSSFPFYFVSFAFLSFNLKHLSRCLLQVLKMMVGNNLKDTQLQQIVDKTIVFADKDEDGKISFDEFCSVVGNTDIHKKMVVDV